MLGGVEGEGWDVIGFDGVTDETTSRVRVEADHEEERQMMCVPECLEALMTNLVMGCGVHEQHDDEHEVTGDSSWLSIMDVCGCYFTDLCMTTNNKQNETTEINDKKKGRRLRVLTTLMKLT